VATQLHFTGEPRSVRNVFVVDKSSSGGGAGPAGGGGGGGAPPGLGAGPPGLGALFAGGTPKLRPVGGASAGRSPGESFCTCLFLTFVVAFSSLLSGSLVLISLTRGLC